MTISRKQKRPRFYVNGKLATEDTFTGPLRPSHAPLTIGMASAPADIFADGIFDEVHFWSVERTPEEIQKHFNQPQQLIGIAGLAINFRLDQRSGDIVYQEAAPKAFLTQGAKFIRSTAPISYAVYGGKEEVP